MLTACSPSCSGLDLQPGRNALVSRAAKAILAAARQHAVHSATTAADDVQEATQADATKEVSDALL